MENIENDNSEEINKYDQEKINELKERANCRVKYKKEIMANKPIQKYLEGFRPSTVESFVDIYTHNKVFWKEYGANRRKNKEVEEEQWINEAFEHLGYIQQKKLFDLQCLWRADQIKLSGIEICWDFRTWENKNILACPFIDPITEAEVELYQSFLAQENKDEDDFNCPNWQDYEQIKEILKNEEGAINHLPEWYQFHNNRTGKDILLQLPDIRGEKEEFYSELWRKNEKQNQPVHIVNIDDRPFLNYHDDEFTKWFVATFESKEVQKWYNDYTYGNKYDDAYETVDEYVRFLLSTGEKISIEGNDNWVTALEKTVTNYKAAKLSEALWEAWEQYQFTIQSGLSFSLEKDRFEDLRKMFAKQILAGRKLNGESEDFDF